MLLVIWFSGQLGAAAQTNLINTHVFFNESALTVPQMVVAAKLELEETGVVIGTNTANVYVSFKHRACVVEFPVPEGSPHKVVLNEHGKITQVTSGLIREVTEVEWRKLPEEEKSTALEWLKKNGKTTERVIQQGTPPPEQ